jgi:4-hydroxy-tetrahydrodipicolinate synthase
MKELKGVIALIPTPLTDAGNVDEDSLRKLIDYDLENGCYGVGVLAAIGEGYLFSSQDVQKIVKTAASHLGGKSPLIVGCPAMGTHEAVEKCKQAEQLGADAILAFNPKYRLINPYSGLELYNHYVLITSAVKLPILPYSQVDDVVPYEVVKQLVEEKRISYMKYGAHDCNLMRKMVETLGDKLFIFVGADTFTLRYLLMGGKGILTATAAVFPKENSILLSTVQKGEMEKARKYYAETIIPWNDCGFYQRWQAVHKFALMKMGIITSTKCMPPISLPIEDFQEEEITYLLKSKGKIK